MLTALAVAGLGAAIFWMVNLGQLISEFARSVTPIPWRLSGVSAFAAASEMPLAMPQAGRGQIESSWPRFHSANSADICFWPDKITQGAQPATTRGTKCTAIDRPANQPVHSDQITAWLADWRRGDENAGRLLLDAVHSELRRIAARFLRNERTGHTLEPNAIVNELWIRLVGGDSVAYQNRAHFFVIAAQTTRRILID